jgi:hypothetical protein
MKDNNNNNCLTDGALEEFFASARNMEIADEGFSRSVSSRLTEVQDRRIVIASRLWTATCAIACIIFLWLSGAFTFALGLIKSLSLYGMMNWLLHAGQNIAHAVCSPVSHSEALPIITLFMALPMTLALAFAAWSIKKEK